jgi:predicted anti-sigma-YlaC factor YlaD
VLIRLTCRAGRAGGQCTIVKALYILMASYIAYDMCVRQFVTERVHCHAPVFVSHGVMLFCFAWVTNIPRVVPAGNARVARGI